METRMRTTMTTLAAGLALVLLAGCNAGHGGYTSEQLSKANLKMQGIKSANEYQQAQQAYLAGDLNKANKLIDRAITLNPSVAISHVLKGRILLERSDLEGALESFQRASACDPKNVEARYYAGIVYERFQQSDKALEQYQAAAEMEPSNPQYVVAAAEMLVDLDRIDEAEQYLNSRSSAFEHNAGVRQTLGHIAMLKGDPKKAVDLFNQARLFAPDDPIILEDLIHAQIITGQFAEAEFNLSRLLKSPTNKDRRDLRHLHAACLMRLDRPLEARELLIGLTGDDAGQKDVEGWIELGNVSYTLKDQNRLRMAATRAIALAPERPEGYTLRALWQRRGGDLRGALDSLSKAIEHRGHDTDPLLLRGMVLQELGRAQEAQAAFAAVLQDDPNSTEAREALDRARRMATVPESDPH
jgi:tetratricopeptide (TPR) repeat protein